MPEAVRHEIRTRHDVNFVVIAGAGTGKTTLLVDKLMALVRDGRAELSEIAAITFTEKAAAEISVRVVDEIERALAQGDDPDGRYSRARDQLDGAAITTLHGFAARLIRERPVDAGLPPDHEILDDVRTRLMFEELYAAWETEQMSRVRDTWRRLVVQRVDARLQELAEAFVQNLDILQDYAIKPPEDVERLADRLETGFAGVCARLRARLPEARDAGDNAAAVAARLLEALPAFDKARLQDPFRALRLLDTLPLNRRKVGKKAAWAHPAALEEIQSAVLEAVEAVDAYRDRWRHLLAHDAWTVLRGFLEVYQAEKYRQGVVEFQDLLIAARNMLKHRKDARRHFQERFRVLLVDEFQDTDPLQAEILFYLAENGARADDWRDVELVPGKLFIVGDPKQSIYRFRRADVEVFEEVRERIVAQGGLERTLVRNFRSLPGVVHFVNAFFGQCIARPDDGGRYQPDYDQIEPFRNGDGGPRVELLVHAKGDGGEAAGTGPGRGRGRGTRRKPEGYPADTARELEARILAARLEQMIGRERLIPEGGDRRAVRPGDVAILFRATTHLDVYTGALQDRGLPVRVVGSTRFYAAQEVVDLANLLRAIASPHDTLALASALRSPAFGFDDVAITLLAGNDLLDYRKVGAVAELAKRGVDQRLLERVGRAYRTLCDLHEMRDRVSMPAMVSEALNRTALLPTAYASFAGEQKVLNLEKVRSLARTYEAAGMRSLQRFADTLLGAIVGKRQEEEMSDTEAGDDVIRILTIHKAKGLEWPVVVLPGLMSSHAGPEIFLVQRDAGAFGFRVAEARTSNWDALKDHERPRADAERVRLFYVAMTRARDYVILSGVQQNRQGKAAMLTALTTFMDTHAGAGWRKPGVVSIAGVSDSPGKRRLETVQVRVAPAGALLGDTPMSPARRDLVSIVERADEPGVARRVPQVLASRERARHRHEALAAAPSPPRRLRYAPPDCLARQALLVAAPGAPTSPRERVQRAAAGVSGGRRHAPGGRDAVVAAVAHFLASPLADRVSRAHLWGVDVPVLFQPLPGLSVEARADLLFEPRGAQLEALCFAPDRGSMEGEWLEALVVGLATMPEPRPRCVAVHALAEGHWEEIALNAARVERARLAMGWNV